MFFAEWLKARVFSSIMLCFPVGAALSSLMLNRVLTFEGVESGIMFILFLKFFVVGLCFAIVYLGLQNKPDIVVNKFVGEAQRKTKKGLKKQLTIRERVKKMNESASSSIRNSKVSDVGGSGWSTYTNDSVGKPSMEISPSINQTAELDLLQEIEIQANTEKELKR